MSKLILVATLLLAACGGDDFELQEEQEPNSCQEVKVEDGHWEMTFYKNFFLGGTEPCYNVATAQHDLYSDLYNGIDCPENCECFTNLNTSAYDVCESVFTFACKSTRTITTVVCNIGYREETYANGECLVAVSNHQSGNLNFFCSYHMSMGLVQ